MTPFGCRVSHYNRRIPLQRGKTYSSCSSGTVDGERSDNASVADNKFNLRVTQRRGSIFIGLPCQTSPTAFLREDTTVGEESLVWIASTSSIVGDDDRDLST